MGELVRPSALVVDDDPLVRRAITRHLAPTFEVYSAGTLAQAFIALERVVTLAPTRTPNLAFVDYELPDGTGLPILQRLEMWPDGIRVLMSANVRELAKFRACGRLVPLVLEEPLSSGSIDAAKDAALAIFREAMNLN